MTLPARGRSAERFDSLLSEESAAGERADGLDARTLELLDLVGALRSVPAAEARPAFVSSLREQLMVAAETELVPAAATSPDLTRRLTVSPRTKSRHERRLGAAIGAIAIVGATTSMAVASQGALPGDTLYPIKRVLENTESGFSVSDQSKGESVLAHASDRLAEVTKLTQGGDADPQLVVDTLQTFSQQADQASQLLVTDYQDNGHQASINKLRTFTATSVTTLAGLEGSVPDAAHDAVVAAAQTLFAIDSSAQQVCPECTGEGITELPGDLLATGATTAEKLSDALPTAVPTPTDGLGQVSGLDPPSNPVKVTPLPTALPTTLPSSLPTALPTSVPTALPTTAVPTTRPSTATRTPTAIASTTNPLDLDPVTGTVTEVINGVVQTVTGVVGGLTGALTGNDANGNPTGGGLLGGGSNR